MLIRQARTGDGPVYAGHAVDLYESNVATDFDSADLDAAEEGIAPDAAGDIEALLAAVPSFLDATPAPQRAASEIGERARFTPPRAAPRLPVPDYAARARLPAVSRPPAYAAVSGFGAGTMTRAVGVSDSARGNTIGDGLGNVIRDNFGHFGFVGTRSR